MTFVIKKVIKSIVFPNIDLTLLCTAKNHEPSSISYYSRRRYIEIGNTNLFSLLESEQVVTLALLILSAFDADPRFTVSSLTRSSSQSVFPSHLNVHRIGEDYP
jgi:hypothetical protein